MITPQVIVSVSGGKDSTAVCLRMKELGIAYESIYMDVGWDNSVTYDYLRGYLPSVIGPITWLRQEVDLTPGYEDETLEIERRMGIGPSAMIRLCVKKGMFPSRMLRWCTEQLKAIPAIQYFKSRKTSSNVIINAIGVRRQESRARSQVPEYEWSDSMGGILVWRPLADWCENQVIDIHKRYNIRPNPNYLNGASRVGCWPCIHSKKSEIRRISESDPNRIAVMERLETLVARRASERRSLAGKPVLNDPSFFANPTSEKTEDGKHAGDLWPIRKVVEWSKTSRGGRQYELFDLPPSEDGCMRWGLCEVASES